MLKSKLERLCISVNGRGLETESGKPFFWLADTAWTMTTELHWKDVKAYLENRKEKGFSVIQIVALDPEADPEMRSPCGEKALINDNPLTPNMRYFEYLDKVIQMAEELELYVLLLPVWGQIVVGDNWFGMKFEKIITEDNAYAYALWLGERYRSQTNIIWALGGDRHPVHNGIDYSNLWRQMAEGLAKGVLGKDLKWNEEDTAWRDMLITYHTCCFGNPPLYSTTDCWTDEDAWISFNMLQSGHNPSIQSYLQVEKDYNREPAKPVLDGEPNYEGMPLTFPYTYPLKTHGGWHVRRRAYWSLFAGSFGHTYGHHSIWRFVRKKDERSLHAWQEAMDQPGAWQMKILRDFIDSRPFHRAKPCQDLLSHHENCADGCLEDHRQACLDSEGNFAWIYFTSGGTDHVDLTRLQGSTVHAWWFNPRDGKCYHTDGSLLTRPFALFNDKSKVLFTTPTIGEENDWILVLDNAEMSFAVPGYSAGILQSENHDQTNGDMFFPTIEVTKG